VLFDKTQPMNPINRRISIIVMNKKAEESALQDGGSVDINSETGDPMEKLIEAVSGVAMTASATEAASAVPARVAPIVGVPQANAGAVAH
jgi:chemotaxis protein MotB